MHRHKYIQEIGLQIQTGLSPLMTHFPQALPEHRFFPLTIMFSSTDKNTNKKYNIMFSCTDKNTNTNTTLCIFQVQTNIHIQIQMQI